MPDPINIVYAQVKKSNIPRPFSPIKTNTRRLRNSGSENDISSILHSRHQPGMKVIGNSSRLSDENCLQRPHNGSLIRQLSGASHAARPLLITHVTPRLQREPESTGRSAAVEAFEADRRRFEEVQSSVFSRMGEMIRRHILSSAGFPRGQSLSTADQAFRVVRMWGVTLDTLIRGLPQLDRSLSGRMRGQHSSTDLEQRQQQLLAALSPPGRQAYQAMMQSVRREAFWRQHLDGNIIYIFPDLTGTTRYNGYTQRTRYQTSEGLTRNAFIIHISKDRLNGGEVDASAATLIHELSHTLYDPNITDRTMGPFLRQLSGLLAAHPRIAAMRQGAPDPEQARAVHERHIRQILYERTGYGEAEIFVHLQQLTHQPPVPRLTGVQAAHHYIRETVLNYSEQLRRIGLPPNILRGIFNSLRSRVELLYTRRAASAAPGSPEHRYLVSTQQLALIVLDEAILALP